MADLILAIERAIADDAEIHPVSGRPNRDHWTGILMRHRASRLGGHCWDAYMDAPAYAGQWCPEIVALARRLHIEEA